MDVVSTGKMALKSDSAKKLTSMKKTQKKLVPESTLYFRNKDIDKSSSGLKKYPNMGWLPPIEKKPRGTKVIMEEETCPRSTPRIKNPYTSPPYSPLSSNKDGDDDDNKEEENSEDAIKEESGFEKEEDENRADEENDIKMGLYLEKIRVRRVAVSQRNTTTSTSHSTFH
ncbi:hypothetical protein FXO38_25240 [Capsicum annuum]|nr:hypothetical protein FXO38_25240 [Capsicum annuum]KAF3636838.1 hypothetical protein FXO37_25245 [Capsicum annuum]